MKFSKSIINNQKWAQQFRTSFARQHINELWMERSKLTVINFEIAIKPKHFVYSWCELHLNTIVVMFLFFQSEIALVTLLGEIVKKWAIRDIFWMMIKWHLECWMWPTTKKVKKKQKHYEKSCGNMVVSLLVSHCRKCWPFFALKTYRSSWVNTGGPLCFWISASVWTPTINLSPSALAWRNEFAWPKWTIS